MIFGIHSETLTAVVCLFTHSLFVFLLRIPVRPEVVSIPESGLIVAQTGESVTLACQVTKGNPQPEVKWHRRERKMPSGEEFIRGLSFTYTSVSRHHSGNYICSADNGFGEPSETTLKLDVQRKWLSSDEECHSRGFRIMRMRMMMMFGWVIVLMMKTNGLEKIAERKWDAFPLLDEHWKIGIVFQLKGPRYRWFEAWFPSTINDLDIGIGSFMFIKGDGEKNPLGWGDPRESSQFALGAQNIDKFLFSVFWNPPGETREWRRNRLIVCVCVCVYYISPPRMEGGLNNMQFACRQRGRAWEDEQKKMARPVVAHFFHYRDLTTKLAQPYRTLIHLWVERQMWFTERFTLIYSTSTTLAWPYDPSWFF